MTISSTDVGTQSPRLSVIMPAFNVEDWIVETVWSILNQSEPSLELIVVDDGSTDRTLELLRDFDDPRLHVMSNPGKGGGSARNAGIARAKGAYLAFADADDIVPQDAYTRLLAQAERTGSEMVVGSHLVFEPEFLTSRTSSLPVYRERLERITIHDAPIMLRDRVCWNRVIKRDAWQQMGLHFVDSLRSNDARAVYDAYCAFTFDVIPDPVYIYRRRRGTTSMTSARMLPAPLTAHLEQEWGCYQTLERLSDPNLLQVYLSGVLEWDLWAHTPPLFDPSHLGNDDYQRARDLTEALIQHAPAETLPRNPAKRLPYEWLRTSHPDWTIAALFGDAVTDDTYGTFDEVDLQRRVELAGADAALRRDTVRHLFVGPLIRVDQETPDDEVMRRFELAARMCRVFDVPFTSLTAEERHLMRVRRSDGVNVIRQRAAQAMDIARARAAGRITWRMLAASDAATFRRLATSAPTIVVRRLPFSVRRALLAVGRRIPRPLRDRLRPLMDLYRSH